MTTDDVAELLHCSPASVLRYVRQCGLPAYSPGPASGPDFRGRRSPWLYDRAEVLAWLRTRRVDSAGRVVAGGAS